MSIHPTAIVHSSADLAPDVEVGPYSIIEAGVTVGAGTVVGPHCVIGGGTELGANNRLFSGAQVGVLPQDLKHVPDAVGRTVLGDNNVFREFVTISSSTVYGDAGDAEKVTRIGSGCLFMATTHVGHDCVVGNGVIMANGAALSGHVHVQDKVIIGGLVGVHQFCTLGTMAFIGGMARVNKDAVPYMIVEGHPARCYGPNAVGLQRSGFSPDAIARIRKMYKLLYRSHLNTRQAVERIESEVEDSGEKRTVLEFVAASERGITK